MNDVLFAGCCASKPIVQPSADTLQVSLFSNEKLGTTAVLLVNPESKDSSATGTTIQLAGLGIQARDLRLRDMETAEEIPFD